MNTATVLHIKGEFQSLLASMNTFCEQPHAVEPQTLEQIKQFYSKLLWINDPLKNERKNHQAFGELDKLELMFASESEQNAWYQRREKLEKMMDRMIEQSSLLILLCQIIQSDPSQKTFDLVLRLLREIIAFFQKEFASFESEENPLNPSIEDFRRWQAALNKFFSQADQVRGESAVKLIDELKSKVECYQLSAEEQSEEVRREEAEVNRQTQLELKNRQAEELQQEIIRLKRQHQEQLQRREAELKSQYEQELQRREAELSNQINQLQKQTAEFQRQSSEKLQRREAELLGQLHELEQKISGLKRQHQEQLQGREAELEKVRREEAGANRQTQLELKNRQAEEIQREIIGLKRQHQQELQRREAELKSQYEQELQRREAELKSQHQEQLQGREAELEKVRREEAGANGQKQLELKSQQPEELQQQITQLKRQHQQQLQQREAELHSQYQEPLQREEQERVQQHINELEIQINEPETSPDIDLQNGGEKPGSIKPNLTLPFLLILLVFLAGLFGLIVPNIFKNKPEENPVKMAEAVAPEDGIKSAEILAIEAGEMIKNAPHPLTVWQTAQDKWRKAIQLLEAVSLETATSEELENQLEIYRTDYNSVTQKIAQEQKAVNNLEAAQKLALEASVMVKNPPHPLKVWQTAEEQWQKSVNLLESIPEDAFVAPEAQEKLDLYRTNLEMIRQRVQRESQNL